MIKIICGPKGAGKTKQIIQLANSNAASAKGLSVFVTDTDRYIHDVIRAVRFINVTEYNVAGTRCAALSRVLSRVITISSTFISTALRELRARN